MATPRLDKRSTALAWMDLETRERLAATKQDAIPLDDFLSCFAADAPEVASVPDTLLEFVLDIVQETHYDCGAAISMAVGRGFGVGPKTLAEWRKALGTDAEESTSPKAIEDYLRSLGLRVEARGDMTLDDLLACWAAGSPVICPVQDYGPYLPKEAAFAYGHYLGVIGGPCLGYVFCQDPSEDNVIADSGSAQVHGRIMVSVEDWMEIWHDEDVDGKQYVQYGIAVSKP